MRKIFCGVKKCFDNSILYSLLCKFDAWFKKSIDDSKIINFLKKPENSDERYYKVTDKANFSFLSFMKDYIEQSKIFNILKFWVENILYLPCMFYGVLFMFVGVLGALNSKFVLNSFLVTLLSVFVAVAGLFLFIFKKSVAQLLNESKFIGKVCEFNFKSETIAINLKTTLIFSIVVGVLALICGLIPVLGILFAALFVSFCSMYTGLVTGIIVTVLPFCSTMVMVALCLFLLMLQFVKYLLGYEPISKQKNSLDVFVVVFAFCYTLGCIASVDFVYSLKSVLVYEVFILFYFVITRVFDTVSKFKNLIFAFNYASIPVALFGLYQKVFGYDIKNSWVDKDMFEGIEGRIFSFFENPNVYGEYLILAIMISLTCILISKSLAVKFVSGLALVLNFACLIYTYSRGCWIGTITALILFLLIYNRKAFIGLLLCGVASFPFWPSTILSRISSVGDLGDTSTSYRVYIWKGTLKMLKDYWTTGIGVGQGAYDKIYPGYSYSTIVAPHAHNLYLVIMTEMGFLGLFAFLALVIFTLKKLYVAQSLALNKDIRLLSAGIMTGLVGFLLQAMFDNVWYNYRVFLLFWIFVAFSSVLYNLYVKENENVESN